MELFLNVLWLVMALAGLTIWRARWAHQKQPSALAAWRRWTAFACAAVMLFFVVSLTDDLRIESPVFDESALGRRQSGHASCHVDAPCHPQHAAGGSAATVPAIANFEELRVSSALVLRAVSNELRETPVQLASGRSPPFHSLS